MPGLPGHEALALLDESVLPAPGEPETQTWGGASMLYTAVEGLTVLGRRDRAAALYDSLVDTFERTAALTPAYDDGRLYERAAGIAALAGRRHDLAEEHFLTALRQADDLPHRVEHAHTLRWYGQLLTERDHPGDDDRAAEALRQAIAEYHRMGMPRHAELAGAP